MHESRALKFVQLYRCNLNSAVPTQHQHFALQEKSKTIQTAINHPRTVIISTS